MLEDKRNTALGSGNELKPKSQTGQSKGMKEAHWRTGSGQRLSAQLKGGLQVVPWPDDGILGTSRQWAAEGE